MYLKMYNYRDVFLIFFTTLGPLETVDFLFSLCSEEDWLTFVLIDTKFFFTFGLSLFSWFLFDTLFDLDDVELVLSVLGLENKKQKINY